MPISLQPPPAFPTLPPAQSFLSQNALPTAPAYQTAAARKAPATPNSTAPQTVSTDKILQTFLDLVKIPSPTGQEEKVRAYIENRLRAIGAVKSETLSPTQNSYIVDKTGNLVVYLPGKQGASKTVLMNAHMDVVPPCLNVKPVTKTDPALKGENRVVYSSGDTVLGGDDKSAIAPLLEALDVNFKNNLPRPNLLLLITAREETGGTGAGLLDPALYTQAPFRADVAISFDINGPQGTVVYQAPQLTKWDVTVKGQSAHAGMEPEKGVNALKAAILASSQIPVGRLDSETTANIGTFNSGEKFNIVPEQAAITGEVRSFAPNRVSQELSKVQNAFVQGTRQVPGSTFDFKYDTTLKAYQTDLNQPVFTPLKRALQRTNLPLLPIRTNGGSDVNVIAQHGIPSIVLSGAYQNPHRTTEFVRVQDMATQAQLILNLWQEYSKGF